MLSGLGWAGLGIGETLGMALPGGPGGKQTIRRVADDLFEKVNLGTLGRADIEASGIDEALWRRAMAARTQGRIRDANDLRAFLSAKGADIRALDAPSAVQEAAQSLSVRNGGAASPLTRPTAASDRSVAVESGAGRGVYFFDQQALPYINRADATLGRAGDAHFFMPLEDSVVITNAASAYRYPGGAPSLERAYVTADDVFGVKFPLGRLSPRLPRAADTTFPHFLEGGHTALRLPNRGGYLVNPTREFVVPGGAPIPSGSTLFRIGPNGTRIPIRGW